MGPGIITPEKEMTTTLAKIGSIETTLDIIAYSPCQRLFYGLS
jgi:hypothetical protein